jgi:hypothetical protein
MGKIKDFVGWLSEGRGNTKDGLSHSVMKIKLFVKRLERQVIRMEIQSRQLRAKSIKNREGGDMEASKLNMKSSLQYKKWAFATESFRVRLEGIQYKMEQAKAMKDFSGVAQDAVRVLATLQSQVKAPQIEEMLKQMDVSFENVDTLMETSNSSLELMDAGSSTAVSEKEVEEALAEVDAEISVKRGVELPAAPIHGEETKIESLEDEIKKLKQQRT